MTRFNISLIDGVNFVIECLKSMKGREVFIPKLKSYRVLDLASAITDHKNIKIIGKNIGEKIHECMFTEDECEQIYEYKNHYVMYDSIYQKNLKINKLKIKKPFNYTSNKTKKFISKNELRKLFKSI